MAFALAHARIRAGELFYLRLKNTELVDDALLVHVASSAGDRPLKTAAARRTLVIRDHMAAQLILEWKACRLAAGSLEEDFVFGDPHRPDRIYQLGRFYVTINQLLKAATGDRDASLHWTSHTWISNQIEAALLASDRKVDVSRLDEIAVLAGHRSVQTSLDHYFHRFEAPLRHCLNAALAKIRLTSDDAAKLSGVSATALRARASARKVDCVSVYWDAILARPIDGSLPSADAGYSTEMAMTPSLLMRRLPQRFEEVLGALSDATAGHSFDVIAARCSRDETWAGRVMLAAVDVLRDFPAVPARDLGIQRGMSASQAAFSLHRLENAREAGINFVRARQRKFAGLRNRLDRMAYDEVARLTLSAWAKCHAGRHLALGDAAVAGRIFGLLHAAGVPADQLAVALVAADPDHPNTDDCQVEAELSLQFQKHYRVPPMFDWRKPRGGKPRATLVWSSGPLALEEDPTGAATSLFGFNAIMLAAMVHSVMMDEDDGKRSAEDVSGKGNIHG